MAVKLVGVSRLRNEPGGGFRVSLYTYPCQSSFPAHVQGRTCSEGEGNTSSGCATEAFGLSVC